MQSYCMITERRAEIMFRCSCFKLELTVVLQSSRQTVPKRQEIVDETTKDMVAVVILYTGKGRKMIHLRTEGKITNVVLPANSV